jgi:hypothetical protein
VDTFQECGNFEILKSGFLLDGLHAYVHFQGICNRLASFWTEVVGSKADKYQEAVQKEN